MKTDSSTGGPRAVLSAIALGLGLLGGIAPGTLAADCSPSPSGLVGWWKGDGSTLDNVAANNGVNQNITYTGGVVGQAFACDPEIYPSGTYTGIQIADQPAYALTNSLTIEGWVRPRGDGYIIFFRGDHRPGLDPYFLSMNGNSNLNFYITDPAGNYVHVETTLPYFQWTHVAATLDGGSGAMSIYTNGVLAVQTVTASRPFGDLIPGESPGVGIGNLNDGGNTFPFLGDIDEIGLYNRALSAGEIQAIYNAGSAGKCAPTSCAGPPAGLAGWWRSEGNALDQVSGQSGVLLNGVGTEPGRVGAALSFNGTNSYVEVPDSPPLRLTNQVTIEFWAKRQRFDNSVEYCVEKGGDWTAGQQNYGVTLSRQSVNYAVTFHFAGGWRGAGSVADGNWHHIAVVARNGDADPTFYIDGVSQPVTYRGGAAVMSLYPSTRPLHIGAQVDPVSGWMYFGNVVLDEVSIYGRLLSAPEIQAIYNAGSAGKCFTPVAPSITQHPTNQTVTVGEAVTLGVTATGTAPLGFQWHFNGGDITSATNSALFLSNVQLAQAGPYSVTVSNTLGSVTSSNAVLTVVGLPPTITVEPQDQSVYEGRTATFRVTATGTVPLRYQWEKNGSPLPNATNATFTLAGVQFGDAGLYHVTVTNLFGGATSRRAMLTVRPAPVCTPLPSGAISWWPGQSNTWDVLGGLDALWANTTYAGYSAGKVGVALGFKGASLTVNHSGELDLGGGGGLTAEAWIQPNGRYVMPVFEWNDGTANVGAGLMLNANAVGRIEATLTDTNAPKRVVTLRSPAAVITNLRWWQHVALTYDKTTGLAHILVNGVVVAQTNAPGLRLQTTAPFFLGYRRSGNFAGARFQGAMDEVSLYNRALSVTEIQAIVAADEAGKCAPPPPPCVVPPVDIAAWWRAESNALDSVAGNHARVIPTNYPSTYQTGLVNTAFAFRGPNFLSVPRSDNLDLGKAGGLTIETWILPTQSRPMPIVEWTDSNSFGASLWLSYSRGPTVLEANLIDASGGFHLIQSPTSTLTYNSWQHVALTYDKATGVAALYVNGNTVMMTNLGSFTPRTDLPMMLGYHPPNSSYSQVVGSPPAGQSLFFGAMDEVALYRRALKPVEIRNLARVRPGKCLELPPTIGSQPQDQVAIEGGAATLGVIAGGTQPLGYQWFFAGQPMAGATSPALSLATVKLADAGAYSVVVSNARGSATSRAATLSVLPAGQCLPTPLGAVAFWRGESNTLDELGNHPAAWGTNTLPGYSTAQTGGGKVNTAFRFNGYSYLQVPGNPDLNVGAGGGFTVEGWIKPDSIFGQQPLVDWNDGKGNVGVGLMYARTGPGVLEVTLTDTNAYSTSERIITFAASAYAVGSPTNQVIPWTHVALTFERVSGKASLFVNGKPVAERTIGPVLAYTSQGQRIPFAPATTGDLFFGWRRTGLYSGPPRFRGSMDEMTVYYRALSPLELQAIYVVGANGKCTPQPSCLPLAEGVAGWWRGESNLLDSVNTNTGIAVGRGQAYTNGVAGLALHFSGTYVRIPAAPALNVGAGDGMTFESWVNPANSSSYALAAWNSGTGEQGVSFGSSPTRGSFYFEANLVDTSGASHVMTAPYRALTLTNWQHLAVTYDKLTGQGVIFVNGSPVTVTNLGMFTPRTTTNLYLGYRPPGSYPGSGYGYVGGMDEVMIHRRALSSGEITAHYRNAANRCMVPPVIVQQPVSQRVNAGSDVTFSVLAVGNPVLRYQWFKGRSPVNDPKQQVTTNSQQPTLTLTNVGEWRQDTYYVIVSNAFGFAVSSNATLLVNYPPVANASNTVPLLISPNGTDAIVVLDGTRSTDPDRDPLAYHWFLAGTGSTLATGAVAVVTLPVGANSIGLVVDDGLLTGTNGITVEIITTAQAVDRLIELVQSGSGNTQPLIASLRAALASINRNQPATAINQLEAFKNKALAQVMPTDPELAEQLLADAQAIIDALNGGTNPAVETLEITSITQGNNGKAHLKIKGQAGRVHVVETSTNLIDWEPVGVAARSGDGAFEYDDSQAPGAGARYYRVVSPR